VSTTAPVHEGRGLQATCVAVDIGDARILQPVSITVPVGEFVALIGPSGSGKSTMLRVLAGVAPASEGEVLIGGEEVRLRSTDIGYVPFGTLLHKELTVREALQCAAQLRLPPQTPRSDLSERVEAVIAELSMSSSADTRIGQLSDGQRRRASCGAELVGRPDVLVLDEPATGLDAALERRVMDMLRGLADEGRGVLVATHATSSLDLCDRVAVLAQGGELRFLGRPSELLDRFEVESFDEVYNALEDDTRVRPAEEHEVSEAIAAPRSQRHREQIPPFGGQVRVLAWRYATCMLRDRRQLLLLLGQAPIIGLAIGFALPAGVFGDRTLSSYYLVMLAFLLVTGSLWLGAITACREIVREKAIIAREVSVGVRLEAYLAAKCAVLLPLAAAEALLLSLATLLIQPIQQGPGVVFEIFLVCVVCAWAAIALGLWLSAAVTTPDQSTSSVPLLLIPQLLFAGAIIPFTSFNVVLKAVGDLMISRWALSALGNIIGLDEQLDSSIGSVTGFDPSFYRIPAAASLGALVALSVIALVGAALTLERRLSR